MPDNSTYPYIETRSVELESGATISVTVESSEPISVDDYLVLRQREALKEAGDVIASIGNALRPPNTPELVLE